MTRELATVDTILELRPIPGADAIECAVIRGWECVVKKGAHQVGDAVVFFEIDSVLPEEPRYEFLRKGCYSAHMNGFRIRTMKLRGQVSQGLALPTKEVFPELQRHDHLVGADVTELLKVRLYEPPSAGQGAPGKPFPLGIPKTDEDRVQNVFARLPTDALWDVTEKLDGSSMTVFVTPEARGVCSRNLERPEEDSCNFWRAARTQNLIAECERICADNPELFGEGIVLQGELLAPGIQKNRYGVAAPRFYVFSVLRCRGSVLWERLSPGETMDLCFSYGLEMVPVIACLPSQESVKAWVELAKGKSELNAATTREGLVVRTPQQSFKVINPDFLLEHGE